MNTLLLLLSMLINNLDNDSYVVRHGTIITLQYLSNVIDIEDYMRNIVKYKKGEMRLRAEEVLTYISNKQYEILDTLVLEHQSGGIIQSSICDNPIEVPMTKEQFIAVKLQSMSKRLLIKRLLYEREGKDE